MKRVFGIFEAAFDLVYLAAACILGLVLLLNGSGDRARMLAGIMALVLVGGDSFHLVPRILAILNRQEERLRPALGRGKQITSVTMTIFYLMLWQIGLLLFTPVPISCWSYLVWLLAAVRIILCLMPQNRWLDRYPPVSWGILRNIPFFLQGAVVTGLYFFNRNTVLGMAGMWLAILLSFGFYLPVVIWSNKNPRIGMLMLPKTCAYLWMLVMCLSL